MFKERPQNFGKESQPKVESGRNQKLARVIAVRSTKERKRVDMRMAELSGSPYQEPNPLMEEAMMTVSIRMNEQFLDESPISRVNLDTSISRIFEGLGDEGFDELIRDAESKTGEKLEITGSQLRSFSESIAKSGISSLLPESIAEDGRIKLLKQVDEAKKIGAEKGIDPASVYEDDKLYMELVRRTQTPEEVARMGIEMARQITPEKIGEMIMNMIPAIAQLAEAVNGNLPLDEEGIKDVRREISNDPEFKAMVETAVLKQRRAVSTLSEEQIIHFWGEKGLDSLPRSVFLGLARS
jgi:hypothetical protein